MVDTSNQPVAEQQSSEPQYDWQNPNLKKFDFGRVMSRTFQGALHCGKESWRPLLLWLGLPFLLFCVLGLALGLSGFFEVFSSGGTDSERVALIGLVIVGSVILAFGYIAIYIMLYIAISHNTYGFFSGSAPSFNESLRRGRLRFWTTIGASLLAGIGIIIGSIFFILPGILLTLGWYLVMPILAMEDKSAVETLSRCWEMSRGSKRWVLLYIIVMLVVALIIQSVFSIITLPFAFDVKLYLIVSVLASILSQAVNLTLTAAGGAAIYYEIRDVKEGAVQETLSTVFD